MMTMKRTFTLFFLFSFLFPIGAYAQYVPVRDDSLNSAFNSFSSNFSSYRNEFNNYSTQMREILQTNTDSIRDIIAAGNPQGVASQECFVNNAKYEAYAWSNGPWAKAADGSNPLIIDPVPSSIPTGGGYVTVNKSSSLRCLLQDLVGFQKMQIMVDIHSLINDYIVKAQQIQLSNQLLSQISAADQNWGKQAVQITRNAVTLTEPVFVTNYYQSMRERADREAQHIIAQAANDPRGPLNLCNPLDRAVSLAKEMQTISSDPDTYTDSFTTCTLGNQAAGGPLTNAGAWPELMANINTAQGLGGVDSMDALLNQPQNAPVSAHTMLSIEATRRAKEAEEMYKLSRTSTGYQGKIDCAVSPNEPDCRERTSTQSTPPGATEQTMNNALNVGREMIFRQDTDAAAPQNAQQQNYATNIAGALNVNTAPLMNSGTAVHNLARELYDTMYWGYFDLNWNGPGETRHNDWALAAMLSIYDNMKFDDSAAGGLQTTVTDPPPGAAVTSGADDYPVFY
jgi:hypothetical protein